MKLNIFLVSATLCLSGNGFAADTSKNRSSLREWATAVIYAVEQLPSIKAKNAERNSVSYRQAAASRPLFNPELSIGYDSGEDNGIGIGISQTIDWSNKREARFATARSAMEAAGANLRAFKAKLLADGLRALNEQHAGKSLSHFADQQVQLLERLILIVDRRLETGDMGLLDAELARLSFSESLQAVAQAERDFRSSQGRVESILGVALDVPNPVIPLPVKVDVKRLVDYARSLPTVEASFKTFQSTKNAIDSAKAQIRADPTIGFGVGKDLSLIHI